MAQKKAQEMRFDIDIDLYGASVRIYVGELNWFLDRMYNDFPEVTFDITLQDMEHYASRIFDMGNVIVIYAMKEMPLAVLLHELSHAAFMLLRTAGIPLSKDKEAYAYLYDYMAAKACLWYGLDIKKLMPKKNSYERGHRSYIG